MKRAWRTTAAGVTSIVAAHTRGAAAAITHTSAFDAAYRVKFTDVRVLRAPEHDEWAAVDSTGSCWDERDLPSSRKAVRP